MAAGIEAEQRKILGEALERGARRQPDELGVSDGRVRADGLDDRRERQLEGALDVHRYLGGTVAERYGDRAHPREALGAAVAKERGESPCVGERRRRSELQVERDERRSRGNERRPGAGMHARRAEVGLEAGLISPALAAHALREPRDPAPAELGARA